MSRAPSEVGASTGTSSSATARLPVTVLSGEMALGPKSWRALPDPFPKWAELPLELQAGVECVSHV